MNTAQSIQGLIISEQDYERLTALVSLIDGEVAESLEEELGRATIVPQKEMPGDVVTMNSRVRFADEETGAETEVTLVYPKSADVDNGKISILAPVGAALIGLRKGQSIDWPVPAGKTRRLKVTEILFQPESSGEWHL